MRKNLYITVAGIGGLVLSAVILTASCGGGGSGGEEVSMPSSRVSSILLVTPDSDDIAGGESVTIVTSGFADDFTVDLPMVYFGSLPVQATAVDSSSIVVAAPRCPEGAVDVVVFGSYGWQRGILRGAFTYEDRIPAEVILVNPIVGLKTGSGIVTIWTQGFADDFSVDLPLVFFGEAEARVTAWDATTLTVTTPPHPAGAVNVEVRTTGIVESVTVEDGFLYLWPPCGS